MKKIFILFACASCLQANYKTSSPVVCETIPFSAQGFIVSKPHPHTFFTVDYTYWICQPSSLRSTNLYPTQNPDQRGIPTQDFFPTIRANSGFKIGLGGFLTRVDWELYTEYTWFQNEHYKNKLNTQTVDPNLYGFTTIGNDFANRFNRIDLVLRKNFTSGEFFLFTPFSGLLAGWDKQWWRDRKEYSWEGSYFLSDTGDNNFIEQKWWGIGPYSGLHSALLFPIGFFCPFGQLGFYLDTGIALAYSHYQLTLNGVVFQDPSEEESRLFTDNEFAKFSLFSPMMEATIGLRWSAFYGKDKLCRFLVNIGMEQQFWLDHCYFNNENFNSAAGNLLFQGLTVRGVIEY